MKHGDCSRCGHLTWNHRPEGGCVIPACDCDEKGTWWEPGTRVPKWEPPKNGNWDRVVRWLIILGCIIILLSLLSQVGIDCSSSLHACLVTWH